MMIVSFAWTTAAFLAGRKTRTRRLWDDQYAAKFHIGDTIQAYDKTPRAHGKLIGYAVIKGLKKEHISLMPDGDFEKEGFAYMKEKGLKFLGMDPETQLRTWRTMDRTY